MQCSLPTYAHILCMHFTGMGTLTWAGCGCSRMEVHVHVHVHVHACTNPQQHMLRHDRKVEYTQQSVIHVLYYIIIVSSAVIKQTTHITVSYGNSHLPSQILLLYVYVCIAHTYQQNKHHAMVKICLYVPIHTYVRNWSNGRA